MLTLCRWAKLSAIGIVLVGTTALQAAPPEPAAMLAPQFQPKQQGVVVTTPSASELASCKVELVNGPGAASGWMLKDAKGQPVRKFVASKGAKAKIDLWCFYLDGQEVYREIDTSENGKPDQYRWFGTGGMRWGVDVNRDGRIDGWLMISAEEVSQEVLKAIATKDKYRFQALLINEKELKALELSQGENDRIKQQVAGAVAKFEQAVAQFPNMSDKAVWQHLEAQAPQCVAADQVGAKQDLVHYKNVAVLYENGGKHDWITLGEIVQVGRAWRLVNAPTAGNVDPGTPDSPSTPAVSKAAQKFIDELQQIDKGAPKPGDAASVIVKYNKDRAAKLEQVIGASEEKDREIFVKQLADSLSTAGQNGDEASIKKLVALRESLAKDPALAGYVAYREISGEYSTKLQTAKGNDEITKVQDGYREKLKTFVEAYPTAEDAPDACLQIAMVSEFMGKETEAKNWYTKLKTDYASHALAQKAGGALLRLGIENQPFELQGATLSGQMFNMQQTKGKVVIVYYWASWNAQCTKDFNNLSKLLKEFNGKGVELVTVSLDTTAQEANTVLKTTQAPGIHMHAPGGLDSQVAVNHGIMVLPQLFLVGKDGKVVSRNVQINSLDDEIKKLTDK